MTTAFFVVFGVHYTNPSARLPLEAYDQTELLCAGQSNSNGISLIQMLQPAFHVLCLHNVFQSH